MNTFISSDNSWALMAITCGWTAFAIYAEQTWTWASRLSSCIIALLGALFLTNFGIIPTNCVFFDDIIWGYVVPMAIPMLLLLLSHFSYVQLCASCQQRGLLFQSN